MSGDPKDEPRAKTAKETRAEFLQAVAGYAHYWASLPDKSPAERCNGLAFSILNILDGTSADLPAMDLVLRPHPDDQSFNQSEGTNWYKNGQIINDGVMLHKVYQQYEIG